MIDTVLGINLKQNKAWLILHLLQSRLHFWLCWLMSPSLKMTIMPVIFMSLVMVILMMKTLPQKQRILRTEALILWEPAQSISLNLGHKDSFSFIWSMLIHWGRHIWDNLPCFSNLMYVWTPPSESCFMVACDRCHLILSMKAYPSNLDIRDSSVAFYNRKIICFLFKKNSQIPSSL